MEPEGIRNGVPRRPPTPVKAYNNLKFLNSRDGRMLRMMSEYLEPQQRFKKYGVEDTIVFFGSARAKPMAKLQQEF